MDFVLIDLDDEIVGSCEPVVKPLKKKNKLWKWCTCYKNQTQTSDKQSQTLETSTSTEVFVSKLKNVDEELRESLKRCKDLERELKEANEQMNRTKNDFELKEISWRKSKLERDAKISALKKQSEKWEQESSQWREYAQSLIQYERFLDHNISEPVTSNIMASRKRAKSLNKDDSGIESTDILSIRQKLQLEIMEKSNHDLRNKTEDMKTSLQAKNEQLDQMGAHIVYLQKETEESIGYIQAEMAKCFAWYTNKKESDIYMLWASYVDSKANTPQTGSTTPSLNLAKGDDSSKKTDIYFT